MSDRLPGPVLYIHTDLEPCPVPSEIAAWHLQGAHKILQIKFSDLFPGYEKQIPSFMIQHLHAIPKAL